MLGSLDDDTLARIAAAVGVATPPGASSTWTVIALLAKAPPLEAVLGLLDRDRLRWACARCGLSPPEAASEEALRVMLLDLARRT